MLCQTSDAAENIFAEVVWQPAEKYLAFFFSFLSRAGRPCGPLFPGKGCLRAPVAAGLLDCPPAQGQAQVICTPKGTVGRVLMGSLFSPSSACVLRKGLKFATAFETSSIAKAEGSTKPRCLTQRKFFGNSGCPLVPCAGRAQVQPCPVHHLLVDGVRLWENRGWAAAHPKCPKMFHAG